MIIAVDGPAASGKGTIARALARHFNLPFLDTGMLYRAVGHNVMLSGGDVNDEATALAACGFEDGIMLDPALRSEAASNAASVVSAHPSVRAALLARQKAFAHQIGGAVLDGRDIGTVIAPDADVKLFVTASAEVRSLRRALESGEDEALVLADIQARDARDSMRINAPLKRAEDAILLDTSDLTIDSAVQQAIALVEARLNTR